MTEPLEPEPNDPTRSGPPMPLGAGACLSQNEVEQLCLKAARGAGLSWGIAEEAGFAAAWLARQGLDGPGALLAQLQASGGRPWAKLCPVVVSGQFRPADGECLCPIALGAALCDHARLPDAAITKAGLRLGPVSHPALLLPFLSDLARLLGRPMQVGWPGGRVVLAAKGGVSGDVAALVAETRFEATLSAATPASEAPATPAVPLFVSAETLAGLESYALRTTVPASETSRAGAGALAGDND